MTKIPSSDRLQAESLPQTPTPDSLLLFCLCGFCDSQLTKVSLPLGVNSIEAAHHHLLSAQEVNAKIMASDEGKTLEVAVSKEEVDAAKAEIEEEDDDEDVAAAGEFEVTKEEMSIMRAELACEFPEDYTYMR